MTDFNQNTPRAKQNAAKQHIEGEPSARRGVLRYGAVLPLAAIATLGLTATMAALVATEFQPQDKTETARFEINPVVEDLKIIDRARHIDRAKEVTPPPPPPPIEVAKADKPVQKIAEYETDIPPFIPPKIDTTVQPITISDRDAQPITRIPPQIPNRFLSGNNSGYCKARFDVSQQGRPFNVSTTLCSNSVLKNATIKSIQDWKYNPKMVDGRPVARSGVETTIRFNLKDESGALLPVPSGY